MNLTWVSLYVIIQKNYYYKFETFRKHPTKHRFVTVKNKFKGFPNVYLILNE